MSVTPYSTMRLAAIDIGSNAVRLQVSVLDTWAGESKLKKLEYVRFPLRLGQDVFDSGTIRPETAERFVRLMGAFRTLLDLYEVQDMMICATSAMREARNGPDVVEQVREATGLQIRLISGEEEANLLSLSIEQLLDHQPYLHIDVGGGSTELNYYYNRRKLASASFPLGSVRNAMRKVRDWAPIHDWILAHVPGKESQPVTSIGTGGNIGKVFELYRTYYKDKPFLTLKNLRAIHRDMSELSQEELMHRMLLNPDRAEVILPATEIYLRVMMAAESDKILVPELGLKDGMLEWLKRQNEAKLKR